MIKAPVQLLKIKSMHLKKKSQPELPYGLTDNGYYDFFFFKLKNIITVLLLSLGLWQGRTGYCSPIYYALLSSINS